MVTLLRRTRQSSEQQRYSQTIESSARNLLNIINDVLDFSKLEAGKMVVRPSEFELSSLIQETMDLLAPRAHEAGLELYCCADLDIPERFRADPHRLRQVLLNLVGNAIKFTEEGYVAVRLTKSRKPNGPETLVIRVIDTGIGITAEDQLKLFQSFSQVDGSSSRQQGGTGLGLSISQHLCEAMAGQLTVDSVLGEGSVFTCTLPITAECAATQVKPLPPRAANALVVSRHAIHRDYPTSLVQGCGMQTGAVDSFEKATTGFFTAFPNDEPPDIVVADFPVGDPVAAEEALADLCAGEDVALLGLQDRHRTGPPPVPGARRLMLLKPFSFPQLNAALVGLIDRTVGTTKVGGDNMTTDLSKVKAERRPGGRVLIVDDNAVNRQVAVELVGGLGYDTDAAVHGEEAVERLKRTRYALVFMDCQMPTMDGYEATARIRAEQGAGPRTPIVALTAHTDAGERSKVLEAGMDDYITKPVSPHQLAKVLERWVGPNPEGGPVDRAPDDEPCPVTPQSQPAVPMADGKLAILDRAVSRSPAVSRLFLESMPTQVAAVERAAAQGATGPLCEAAHRLKGSCLSIGARASAAACSCIEASAKQGVVAATEVAHLHGLIAQVSAALEKEVSATARPPPV